MNFPLQKIRDHPASDDACFYPRVCHNRHPSAYFMPSVKLQENGGYGRIRSQDFQGVKEIVQVPQTIWDVGFEHRVLVKSIHFGRQGSNSGGTTSVLLQKSLASQESRENAGSFIEARAKRPSSYFDRDASLQRRVSGPNRAAQRLRKLRDASVPFFDYHTLFRGPHNRRSAPPACLFIYSILCVVVVFHKIPSPLDSMSRIALAPLALT